MPPKLSINIPTYQRQSLLHRLLQSVVGQPPSLLSQIAVQVFDNSPNDDKVAIDIISNLSQLCFQASYTRNSRNIGGTLNISNAYAAGLGEWVWVIGDDDYLMPHSLSKIIKLIDESVNLNDRIGFIQFGSACIDDRCFIRAVIPSDYHEPKLYAPADLMSCDGSVHSVAFISSFIIKTDVWSSDVMNQYRSNVTLYFHVFCIMDGLRRLDYSALRVADHLIFAGYGRNDYYASKVCIARLSEFPRFDKLAFNVGPIAKRNKKRLYRSNLFLYLRQDIFFALKLSAFRDSFYSEFIYLLKPPQSPFLSTRIALAVIEYITRIAFIRNFLKSSYSLYAPDKKLNDVSDNVLDTDQELS